MTARLGTLATGITGGLSADNDLNARAQIRLQGAGSLQADYKHADAWVGEARFAASGNFQANAYISTQIVVSFAEFELTVSDRDISARFNGAGNLSAYAALRNLVQVRFAGAGGLSVDATITSTVTQWQGQLRFNGSGSLSVNAYVPTQAVVSFAEFELTVSDRILEARFAGVGNLSAYARLNAQIQVRYGGAGSLSIDSSKSKSASAIFGGIGNVSVDAAQVSGGAQQQISATFAGVGNFSAYATQVNLAFATFSGLGNVSADSRKTSQLAATFAGLGNLQALVSQQNAAAATFGGIGSLSAFATITGAVNQWSGEARFAGVGALSAAATQNQAASAFFTGVGNLFASTQATARQAAATFAGIGNLSFDADLALQAAIRFNGLGNLSVFVQNIKSGAATFSGNGSLTVSASLGQAISVRFDGAGNLSVNTISVQQAAATFGGIGNFRIFVEPQNVKAGSASFNGIGSLSAYAQSAMQTAVRLGGTGQRIHLLLHLDGIDGSTTLVDATGRHTFSQVDGELDTDQAKFGGSSLLTVPADSVITSSSDPLQADFLFGTGDFTIDSWIRRSATGTDEQLTAVIGKPGQGQYIIIESDKLVYRANGFVQKIIGSTSISANAWHHVALTRRAGVTRLFLDGTQEGSDFADANDYQNNVIYVTGDFNLGLNGWTDELRIIKGYADWISGFSPPTIPYNESDITAGDLRIYAQQNKAAAAIFNGTGGLRANATIQAAAAARFNGVGNLSAISGLQFSIAATFGGVGNLSAFATITGAVHQYDGAAIFNGAGALSAATISQQQAQATFTGAGNLSPNVVAQYLTQVRFAGAGNVSADSLKYKLASAFFNGVGNLSVAYSIVKYAEIRFEGSGNLRVGTISRQQAQVRFNGRGNLQAEITGGRGPRLPTREGISGETVATRASGSVPRRPDQFEPIRNPSTMPRRQKITHG